MKLGVRLVLRLAVAALVAAVVSAPVSSQGPPPPPPSQAFFNNGNYNYSNPQATDLWQHMAQETIGGNTEDVAVVEWGDTLWVGFQNANYDATQAPPKAHFRRLDPNGTSTYGFDMDCAPDQAKQGIYRVGVDFGFYCSDGADPADPTQWRLGEPQRAKTINNNKVSEDPKAGDTPITDANGTGRILLTPGLWAVWSNQLAAPGQTTPTGFIHIMNPIGLLTYNPYTNTYAMPWAAGALYPRYGDPGTGTPDPTNDGWNGNANFNTNRILPDFSPTGNPMWTLGRVDHGMTSANYAFGVCDRSNLDQVPNLPVDVLLTCRMQHGDMNPTGAPPTTNMDQATYDANEYPPIYRDRVSFAVAATGTDPRTESIPLPRRAGGAVQPVKCTTQVRVLQYQPDTTYSTGSPGVETTPALFSPDVHDADPVRVWFDWNGDGSLERIDAGKGAVVRDPNYYLTATGPRASYELADRYAEPYREFNISLNVPADRRLRVEEQVLDLGKHPHNAVTGASQNDLPPMRPFTVTNLGNVNLMHLRVAHEVNIAGNAGPSDINLYCPNSEYDPATGYGVFIAPMEKDANGNRIRQHVWWSFDTDPSVWEAGPTDHFMPGHLRKARPGAPSPSSVAGTWVSGPTPTVSGPRISIISPFGQPVGTYASGLYRVYEDVNQDGMLDGYLDTAGAFHTGAPSGPTPNDDVMSDPFTVKITVTDRQLTEELGPQGTPGVYGIDRQKVLQSNAPTGAGDVPRYAMDTQPAVLRYYDGAQNMARLALYWCSNRVDSRAPNPPVTAPAGDWFYLFGSRSFEGKTSDTYPWPYWTGTANGPGAMANYPEVKVPLASGFTGAYGGVQTERYTSPSLVPTWASGKPGAPYFLLYQGDAQVLAGGMQRPVSRIFCNQLDNNTLLPGASTRLVGRDEPGLMKHGVRGLAFQAGGINSLWAFYHGGQQGRAMGYFTWCDSANFNWSKDQQLPLTGDFTDVHDLMPVLWSALPNKDAAGTPQNCINVVFTGQSWARRTSSIYMAQFDPVKLADPNQVANARQSFSRCRYEVLSPVNRRTFTSRNLEWLAPDPQNPAGCAVAINGQPTFLFPRIYRRQRGAPANWPGTLLTPDPEAGYPNNAMKNWVYDAKEQSYTYEFNNFVSVDFPDLNGKNKVTFYPHSGVVMFSKPMDEGDVVAADYVPGVLRLTNGAQAQSSPCAFLDTRVGPAQAPTRLQWTDGKWYFKRAWAQRDRLWVFWTSKSPQVANPTVWFKTLRAMVQLPTAIQPTQDVTVQDVTSGQDISALVTIDAAKGRLFFPATLEGHRVQVSYSGGTQPWNPYISWSDEVADSPLPIDTVNNEGRLCAVPDIAPQVDFNDVNSTTAYLNNLGTWRVWLFWASTGPKITGPDGAGGNVYAYDTDLRYMAIAPRLDTTSWSSGK